MASYGEISNSISLMNEMRCDCIVETCLNFEVSGLCNFGPVWLIAAWILKYSLSYGLFFVVLMHFVRFGYGRGRARDSKEVLDGAFRGFDCGVYDARLQSLWSRQRRATRSNLSLSPLLYVYVCSFLYASRFCFLW